jgi:hypothetical protein
MKFEGIVSPAAPSAAEAGGECRFTLDHGVRSGQTFNARLRICANPCCPCGVVGFECRRLDTPGERLAFDVDLYRRQLNTKVQSAPDGVALGRAFVAEAQPGDWAWLQELFSSVKRRQMETMNLDTLPVDLPRDVQRGDGTMVGYAEIFPWAEALRFTRDGVEWVVDDQYCVRPECGCTEVGLAFYRMSAGERPPDEPVRCSAFLFHNYRSHQTDVKESRPGTPNPGQLVHALRAAHPGLADTLRHRHAQLKQLGRRLMPKRSRRTRPSSSYGMRHGPVADDPPPPPPPPAPAASAGPKVGRNDPCPCGSGKKFKKCCGAG